MGDRTGHWRSLSVPPQQFLWRSFERGGNCYLLTTALRLKLEFWENKLPFYILRLGCRHLEKGRETVKGAGSSLQWAWDSGAFPGALAGNLNAALACCLALWLPNLSWVWLLRPERLCFASVMNSIFPATLSQSFSELCITDHWCAFFPSSCYLIFFQDKFKYVCAPQFGYYVFF